VGQLRTGNWRTGFQRGASWLCHGLLLLALVRVKLGLNGRLRVSLARVARELGIAQVADSEHRNVSYPLHDPKIPLRHGTSLPQPPKLSQPIDIRSVLGAVRSYRGQVATTPDPFWLLQLRIFRFQGELKITEGGRPRPKVLQIEDPT
jgi:hypothetical protein